MKFTTEDGSFYTVNLQKKECGVRTSDDQYRTFSFDKLSHLYVGSRSVTFYEEGDYGRVMERTAPVVSIVEGDPRDAVSGEEGNVVFRTSNSVYEVNQEQKLYRRLAGVNEPYNGLDLEWIPYLRIDILQLGYPCQIVLANPMGGPYVTTSTVRKIEGNFIDPTIAIKEYSLGEKPDAPAA